MIMNDQDTIRFLKRTRKQLDIRQKKREAHKARMRKKFSTLKRRTVQA